MDYFRLVWLFFRVSAMNEVQYRVNFFVQLLQSALALATGLVVLALVFSYTDTLAGWQPVELLAVMGVHILMGGIIQTAIQPNMVRLMNDVQEGTLDFALTKPVDAQLIVSVRELRIWQTVDVVTGLIVLVVAVGLLETSLGLWQALAFAAALLMGAVMIYSFWLILTTGAFWIVRIEHVIELFQGIYQAGRWPVTIYPGWLRLGLTFLVPLAFAVTVPAEALTGRLTPETLLAAAGLAAGLFTLARLFWRFGLRNYAGASA